MIRKVDEHLGGGEFDYLTCSGELEFSPNARRARIVGIWTIPELELEGIAEAVFYLNYGYEWDEAIKELPQSGFDEERWRLSNIKFLRYPLRLKKDCQIIFAEQGIYIVRKKKD